MPVFGQIVVGPPGSGKTTFCNGMSQFLTAMGRKVSVVNLDPANDTLSYECAVDVRDLVEHAAVMEKLKLGPNGAILYAMEYLQENFDWLEGKLRELKGHYIVFDFPGQVELYTTHPSVKSIIERLTKLDYRLCAVHLVDSHHCTDAAKYLAVLMLSLTTMLKLELPHVNVLSKIDTLEQHGPLQFDREYYEQVLDLDYLCDGLDRSLGPRRARFAGLNKAMASLVEDFNLVNFIPLDVSDKHSMARVLTQINRANGYCVDVSNAGMGLQAAAAAHEGQAAGLSYDPGVGGEGAGVLGAAAAGAGRMPPPRES